MGPDTSVSGTSGFDEIGPAGNPYVNDPVGSSAIQTASPPEDESVFPQHYTSNPFDLPFSSSDLHFLREDSVDTVTLEAELAAALDNDARASELEDNQNAYASTPYPGFESLNSAESGESCVPVFPSVNVEEPGPYFETPTSDVPLQAPLQDLDSSTPRFIPGSFRILDVVRYPIPPAVGEDSASDDIVASGSWSPEVESGPSKEPEPAMGPAVSLSSTQAVETTNTTSTTGITESLETTEILKTTEVPETTELMQTNEITMKVTEGPEVSTVDTLVAFPQSRRRKFASLDVQYLDANVATFCFGVLALATELRPTFSYVASQNKTWTARVEFWNKIVSGRRAGLTRADAKADACREALESLKWRFPTWEPPEVPGSTSSIGSFFWTKLLQGT